MSAQAQSNGSASRSGRGSADTAVRSYRINLALFLAAIVVYTYWFYLHLYPFFSRALVAGTPLTLIALLKLIQSFLPKERGGSIESTANSVLSRPTAIKCMLVFLLFGLFLLAITSSVYVEHAGDKGAFEVAVEREARVGKDKIENVLLLPPLRITSYDAMRGGVYFFRLDRLFAPTKLTFRVTKPYGYREEVRQLRTFSAIHMRVPADFKDETYRVLRIAPVQTLIAPTVPGVETGRTLRIFIAGEPVGCVEDYILDTVYLGVSTAVINGLVAAEDNEDYARPLQAYMYSKDSSRPLAELYELARLAAKSARFIEIPEPQPKATVSVVLDDNGAETKFFAQTVRDETGIQSFFFQEDR